jgi:membrane fusion protein, multidrug efflux system
LAAHPELGGHDDAFLNAHVERVSSRIAGRVESVRVQDNEFVHAGQLLVALDDRDLRVATEQREAKLTSAKADVTKAEAQQIAAQAAALQVAAQLESAKAKSDNSQIELNRAKRLREAGAVAQQELDTAEKNALTDQASVVAGEKQVASLQAGIRYTEAAVEVAKAAVAEAEASLATARLDLSYAAIVAKQDGRVTVKTVEPGNYVQPGQQLMAIVSGDVWIEANYKETQLAQVRPGQEAVVRVDAYPDLELHGHVDSIQAGSGAQFSLLPPENATGNYVKVVQRVPVKIVLDLAGKDIPLLGPGMSVVPEIRVRN